MNQSVTIKGTKSGIILVLDPGMAFDQLREEIKKHFIEAASFLGKNNMGLIIRGRKLTETEEEEVLGIIADNTQLSITCVVDEESETERLFNMSRTVEEKVVPVRSENIDMTIPADV